MVFLFIRAQESAEVTPGAGEGRPSARSEADLIHQHQLAQLSMALTQRLRTLCSHTLCSSLARLSEAESALVLMPHYKHRTGPGGARPCVHAGMALLLWHLCEDGVTFNRVKDLRSEWKIPLLF